MGKDGVAPSEPEGSRFTVCPATIYGISPQDARGSEPGEKRNDRHRLNNAPTSCARTRTRLYAFHNCWNYIENEESHDCISRDCTQTESNRIFNLPLRLCATYERRYVTNIRKAWLARGYANPYYKCHIASLILFYHIFHFYLSARFFVFKRR